MPTAGYTMYILAVGGVSAMYADVRKWGNDPFRIWLDQGTKTDGVVMRGQARMLDLNSRRASSEEKAPADIPGGGSDHGLY